MSNELIFLGGLESKRWLDNGKNLSRNFRQGNRIYDSEGIATALTAEPVGAAGGYTSLYLVRNEKS